MMRIRIFKTSDYNRWYLKQTIKTQTILDARLDRLGDGHIGDHKRFLGLIELRWKNGLRVYGFFKECDFIVVLIGGNKNGQDKDIKKAGKIKNDIVSGAYTSHE